MGLAQLRVGLAYRLLSLLAAEVYDDENDRDSGSNIDKEDADKNAFFLTL